MLPGRRPTGGLHRLHARRKAEVTMAPEPHLPVPGRPQEPRTVDQAAAAEPAEERKTMAGPPRQRGLAGPLDAGPLEPLIGSSRLHLAAEAKAARTVQGLHRRGALVRRRLAARPGRQDQLGPG